MDGKVYWSGTAVAGLNSNSIRTVRGAISFNSSTHFPPSVPAGSLAMKPVMLPPGCARFEAKPLAFSIAGGGVLTWIGFSMLRSNSPQAQDAPKDRAEERRSLTPLILFAASPGTITGVITLAVAHSKLDLPVTALVAVAVAAVVMWIVMVLVAREGTRAKGGFLRDTTTRFMGLIVIAMGVQFALTGFRDFFTAHP